MTGIDKIEVLGILAGGGDLPWRLIESCEKKGIEPFVIGFEGQTDPALMEGHRSYMCSYSKAGQILKTLKAHHVGHVVMIGGMKRPSFSSLCPDLATASLIARIGFRALGDDGLLKAIRNILQQENIQVHGVDEFVDELLASKGAFGAHEPSNECWRDIERGVEVASALGEIDVGQSVIIQDGLVLGVEAVEGTDDLIKRCKELKRKDRGGALVKLFKPQQDRRLDMPSIGLKTIQMVHDAGFSGMAVQAGSTLVMDLEKLCSYADEHGLFVVGIDVQEGEIVRS